MKNQKWTGLILTGSLFVGILLIPTLVVVPFTGSNESTVAQEAVGQSPTTNEEISSLSPFSVDVLRSETGLIEEVPLETYVARVVASEMPASFELEALKAQSLAARTYIVRHLLEGTKVSENADVTDTVNHQVYKDDQQLRQIWGEEYASNMEKVTKAVKATAGEIITYENAPIMASFFSTSNGYTENAGDYWPNDVPYLKSVESPWDKNSPKFANQKIVTVSEVVSALGLDSVNIEDTTMTLTEGNRVEEVKFGKKSFTGREIRETFALPSSDFSIEQKGDHIIFTTQGYGHGVGMSQYGANGMAQSGKTYKEIIQHYYQGIEIAPISKQTASVIQ